MKSQNHFIKWKSMKIKKELIKLKSRLKYLDQNSQHNNLNKSVARLKNWLSSCRAYLKIIISKAY